MADRDEFGHFLPGHNIGPPLEKRRLGGRPRNEDVRKLQEALSGVLDNGTLSKWRAAMARKIKRGDPWATQFVFERTAGKVPDILAAGLLDGDGAEWLKRMIGVDISDSETLADAGAETAGPSTSGD